MKIVDINTWKRKGPYKTFIDYTNPVFSISSRIDVTPLVKFSKESGSSFFTNTLFLVSKALNDIEDLRYRINDGRVVLYERVNPSYIVMTEADVISSCKTVYSEDYSEFYSRCRKDIESATKEQAVDRFDHITNDCFYVSCLPWVDLVSVINPYNLADKEQSSIPRITWGKYVKEGETYKMGIDIAAHHAMTDGKPLAIFINKLSELIKNIQDVVDNKGNTNER